MGTGVAAEIRKRYPKAWKADCDAAKDKTNTLGNLSYARVLDNPDRFVFNLYGQQHFGRDRRHLSYDALVTALQKMRMQLEEWQDFNDQKFKVAIPYKIGCRNAGGSWSIVESILMDVFDNSDVDLVIVRNPLYDAH